MQLLIVLFMFLLSTPAWAATTYHINKAGSNANSCATAQSATPANGKLTITTGGNGGASCMATNAGDTLVIHAGTYNEGLNNIPGGSSEGTRSQVTVSPGNQVIITGETDFVVTRPWITVDGFGGQLIFEGGGIIFENTGSSHIRLKDLEVRNVSQVGGILEGGTFNELININSHHNGFPCPAGGGPSECHGGYLTGDDGIIRGGSFHHNSGHGVQVYRSGGAPSRWTVNNVKFFNNGTSGLGVYWGTGNIVYNALSYNNGGDGFTMAAPSVKLYSVTSYGNNSGINCRATQSATDFAVDSRNSIFYANGVNLEQCTGSSTSITTFLTTNPGFVSVAGGNEDFHIAAAGSNANVGGATLPPPYDKDAENLQRTPPYTKGLYQFAGGAPPSPNIIAWYKGDGNANDSSGNNFNGTLTGGALANGAPIVSGQSFVFDGIDDYVTVPGNSTLRPTAITMALWMNATVPPANGVCRAINMGTAYALGWEDTGHAFCFINNGPTATMATGSVLSGTNQALVCTYDPAASGAGIRLYQGSSQVAFTSTTAAMTYTGTENLLLGGIVDGSRNCAVRMDDVKLANFAWTQADVEAYFNSVSPTAGISQTHHWFSGANAPEGNWIGTPDTDQSVALTTPWGVRWSLHNATCGNVTLNFRPFCRINHSPGGWGSWTELTTSFGAFGLRYLTDSAVNVGSPTTPLLPLDGFTGVPGKYLADVVDLTYPYDAAQKMSFAPGQHAELEIRLQAGSPVVAGDLVQCKPYHESGTLLSGGYGVADVNIRTMTLAGAAGSVRFGGATRGGLSR